MQTFTAHPVSPPPPALHIKRAVDDEFAGKYFVSAQAETISCRRSRFICAGSGRSSQNNRQPAREGRHRSSRISHGPLASGQCRRIRSFESFRPPGRCHASSRQFLKLLCPSGRIVRRHEQKPGLRIKELCDKPWAGRAVHFHVRTGNPFHSGSLRFIFVIADGARRNIRHRVSIVRHRSSRSWPNPLRPGQYPHIR